MDFNLVPTLSIFIMILKENEVTETHHLCRNIIFISIVALSVKFCYPKPQTRFIRQYKKNYKKSKYNFQFFSHREYSYLHKKI